MTRQKKQTGKRTYDRGRQLTLALHARLANGSDKLVLLILLDYLGGNETCHPSYQTIADCGCITRRTACTAVKRLVEAGVVKFEHRHDDSGDLSSNRYTIDFARLEEMQQDDGGSETTSPPPRGEQVSGGEMISPPPSETDSTGGETVSPQVVQPFHQGGEMVAQEPPIEPPIGTVPPYPPAECPSPPQSSESAGGSVGGGGMENLEAGDSELTPADETDDWVSRIYALYPASNENQTPKRVERSMAAIRQVIEYESSIAGGATPREIFAAVRHIAERAKLPPGTKGRITSPLWARNWFDADRRKTESSGGQPAYFTIVEQLREEREREQRRYARERRYLDELRRTERESEDEGARARQVIESMSDGEREDLRQRVVKQWPHLAEKDPATSSILRRLMLAEHEREVVPA